MFKSDKKRREIWIALFALTLTGVITLSSPIPAVSQAPQSLKAEIEARAEEHAQNEKYQVKKIQEAYQGQGLDHDEILKIYDQAYNAEVERGSEIPWLPWVENQLPWLIAAIFAIIAIFRDTVKHWVKKFLDGVGEILYQRLAGQRIFRNIALQRYRQAIIAQHKQLKIPFRPERPLEMSEIYVPLKGGHSSEIDAYQAVIDHPRLMVKGAPGSGKTMLMHYLLLTYAQGKLLLPGRPIPILLELHWVDDSELTQEQLMTALVDAFERYRFPKAEAFVKESLAQGKLMLLFDGLDEVNSDQRSLVVQCIRDLMRKYRRCRAVITCRTMVYDQEFDSDVDRSVEIAEFSDRQIRVFLEAWREEMPSEKSIEQLLQTLRDRPLIKELARNPLLLTIIAYLYADTDFDLPYSRAEFYERASSFLLEHWHQERNQFRAIEKQRLLEHLGFYNQKARSRQEDRKTFSYETALVQVQEALPSLNLNDTNTEPILKEIVERSGLLLLIDGGTRYQFAHLTLQEYFTAKALIGREQELLEHFRNDRNAWREVVKLWCGLAQDSTAMVEQVYERDPITGWECLADAVKVDDRVANRLIDDFKSEIATAAEDEEIANAIGTVASSSRPRGQLVLGFLSRTLAEDNNLENCKGAVATLGTTNLPQAVSILEKHYARSDLKVSTAMIRLGNLAIESLVKLAADSESMGERALRDLRQIGTSEAAQALVPFLWDSNEIRAAYGAVYLAQLLSNGYIEDALRECNLPSQWQKAKRLDWVWEPFSEPSQSPLPVIASRVAYLLTQIPSLPISKDSFWKLKQEIQIDYLDARLITPLCTIEICHPEHIPKKWSAQADDLLEYTNPSPEVEEKLLRIVNQLLSSHDYSWWRTLLSSLEPRLQLDLLNRLMNYSRLPTREDWRNLSRPLKYEFKTGGHYRTILAVAGISSTVALAWVVMLFFQNPDRLPAIGLVVFSAVIELTFWSFLSREQLKPEIFSRFGALGFLTFGNKLGGFLNDQTSWAGVKLLGEMTNNWVVGGAYGIMMATLMTLLVLTLVAINFVGGSSLFLTPSIAIGYLVILTISLGIIWAVNRYEVGVTSEGASDWMTIGMSVGSVAGAWTGAWTSAVETIDIVEAAVATEAAATVMTIAGLGLGIWAYGEDKENVPRWMAVFALPFFCWLPVTLSLVVWMLWQFWQWRSLLVVASLILLCALLWWWGQKRDRKARNPLHGILDKV